jgi:hypothetical protein
MEEAARAGFPAGPDQGIDMYDTLVEHPEGILVGVCDAGKNIGELATADKKIQVHDLEFGRWLDEIDPTDEEKRLALGEPFPLILIAGRHMDYNANTNYAEPGIVCIQKLAALSA